MVPLEVIFGAVASNFIAKVLVVSTICNLEVGVAIPIPTFPEPNNVIFGVKPPPDV